MSNKAIVVLELSYSSLINDPFLSLKELPAASVAGISVGDSFWVGSSDEFKKSLEQESGRTIDTSVKVVVKDKQHIFWTDLELHPVVRLALLVVDEQS